MITLILDVIKPYKGGNDNLYALHSLDIMDKHRLLIPIISVTALTGVSAKIGASRIEDCTFAVRAGGVLNAIGFVGEFELTNKGNPEFLVLFNEGHELANLPVISTLQQLSQLVSSTVQALEQEYLTTI
jgi:hypothetical protein